MKGAQVRAAAARRRRAVPSGRRLRRDCCRGPAHEWPVDPRCPCRTPIRRAAGLRRGTAELEDWRGNGRRHSPGACRAGARRRHGRHRDRRPSHDRRQRERGHSMRGRRSSGNNPSVQASRNPGRALRHANRAANTASSRRPAPARCRPHALPRRCRPGPPGERADRRPLWPPIDVFRLPDGKKASAALLMNYDNILPPGINALAQAATSSSSQRMPAGLVCAPSRLAIGPCAAIARYCRSIRAPSRTEIDDGQRRLLPTTSASAAFDRQLAPSAWLESRVLAARTATRLLDTKPSKLLFQRQILRLSDFTFRHATKVLAAARPPGLTPLPQRLTILN